MTAVEPEYGRLDRILAEQAATLADEPPLTPAEQAAYRTAEMVVFGVVSVDGVERLRAMVAALEAECAALTDALTAVTHEFRSAGVMCGDSLGLWPVRCGHVADHRVHRTPAVARAELEGQ